MKRGSWKMCVAGIEYLFSWYFNASVNRRCLITRRTSQHVVEQLCLWLLDILISPYLVLKCNIEHNTTDTISVLKVC